MYIFTQTAFFLCCLSFVVLKQILLCFCMMTIKANSEILVSFLSKCNYLKDSSTRIAICNKYSSSLRFSSVVIHWSLIRQRACSRPCCFHSNHCSKYVETSKKAALCFAEDNRCHLTGSLLPPHNIFDQMLPKAWYIPTYTPDRVQTLVDWDTKATDTEIWRSKYAVSKE